MRRIAASRARLAEALAEIAGEDDTLSPQEKAALDRAAALLKGRSAGRSAASATLRKREAGFGFISLLLVGIALAGVITVMVANSTTSNISASNIQNRSYQLRAQIDIIRSAIVECAIRWPAGDNGTGFNPAYPSGQDVLVSALDCPGYPGANKNLWAADSTKRAPLPPGGFGDWLYTNNADGVLLYLDSTTVESAEIAEKVVAGLGDEEASVVAGQTINICIIGTTACL